MQLVFNIEGERYCRYDVDFSLRPDVTESDNSASLACNLNTGSYSVVTDTGCHRLRHALCSPKCTF